MASLPQVRMTRTRRQVTVRPVAGNSPREREAEAVLELVRPAIREDGGDVELVGVRDSTVLIRFLGACVGCPSSAMTLRDNIARQLTTLLPWVTGVEASE